MKINLVVRKERRLILPAFVVHFIQPERILSFALFGEGGIYGIFASLKNGGTGK